MAKLPFYKDLTKKVQKYVETLKKSGNLNETEKELRSSEMRYRRLVESLERDYIIYSHDTRGNFTYLSPSIVNVLGYTQAEFMGHYAEYMTDNPINQRAMEKTKSGIQGQKQSPYEAEFWHKNGSRRHLRTTEVPVFDESGNSVGIEGIVQDITAQKEAELERECLIANLKEALNKVKTLSGLLPICSYCKKIRNDKGYWDQIEAFITENSNVTFSHGICPSCADQFFPELGLNDDP